VNQCGNFADKEGGFKFSRFRAGVFYGRPLKLHPRHCTKVTPCGNPFATMFRFGYIEIEILTTSKDKRVNLSTIEAVKYTIYLVFM